MPSDPAAVLHRLTERLAPLERSLHLAYWAAATDSRPETSAARRRAEEALLAVLADPELFAEVEAALAGDLDGDPLTRRALGKARLDLLARQIPADARAELVRLQAKVELLQGLRRPEGRTTPDWASKIHLAVAPVYYQSYLLGELMAFQVDAAVREAVGGFVGRPEAGAFLAERVFAPGASRTWRDLVVHATGRPLGTEAFLAGLAD
jgi:hypothetical protein